METKPFYKSKTFYGAISVFVGGGLMALGLEQFGQPLIAFGTALGFVGLRTANGTKIE